jgi:hypothetical protein
LHTGSSVNGKPRCRSCMHERAASLAQGPERLLGGRRRHEFVQVPIVPALGR